MPLKSGRTFLGINYEQVSLINFRRFSAEWAPIARKGAISSQMAVNSRAVEFLSEESFHQKVRTRIDSA